MNYDIYLCYRRDGGAPMAQLLYTKLTDSGYKVFIDLEEMQQGDFNEQLLTVIENANDIVLILSKGALDRCVDEGDCVRRELCHALQREKNIVPFQVPGFEWPANLPQNLEKLPKLQWVEYHPIYYSASLEKLESYLLSQKHPKS